MSHRIKQRRKSRLILNQELLLMMKQKLILSLMMKQQKAHAQEGFLVFHCRLFNEIINPILKNAMKVLEENSNFLKYHLEQEKGLKEEILNLMREGYHLSLLQLILVLLI